MKRTPARTREILVLLGALAAVGCGSTQSVPPSSSSAPAVARGRPSAASNPVAPVSVIEHDSMVAVRQPGPHQGGGETTAYSFFRQSPELGLVFRKRVLHPGAAIGLHRQEADEIYYVLSGRGELTLNGVRREVGPGTAILTRPGSAHALKQVGSEDLVILVSYLAAPNAGTGAAP